MEFSCHSWGFNDKSVEEAFGTIARMGFRYVDLGTGPHLNPLRTVENQVRLERFRTIWHSLRTFNLKLADMYFFLPRIAYEDEKKRQTDLTFFKVLLPIARHLGTPGITVSPGLLQPSAHDGAWERCVGALQEMLTAATAANLALSIEPHLDSMAYRPDTIKKLLAAVDGLQLTLDWSHMVYQGIAHDAIVDLLPHTRHVHIRQAREGQLQTCFAEGTIDLGAVMNALKQAGYQGIISVEIMQTTGWHGMAKVSSVIECIKVRDALREARDKPATPLQK